MVAIQRRDSLEWAIPGGMVDAGEKATATLKREFIEEALNDKKGNAMSSNITEENRVLSCYFLLQFKRLNNFSMKRAWKFIPVMSMIPVTQIMLVCII